jgi:hypothetical protein
MLELINLSVTVTTGMMAIFVFRARNCTTSAVAIYCFGTQKSTFISNLMIRTVIDITQLGCPRFADISFPTISYTFACYNKSKHACVFQSAY